MVTNNKTLKKLHDIQTQCSACLLLWIPYLSGLEYPWKKIHTHVHTTFTRRYVYTHASTIHANIIQPYSHAHAFARTVPTLRQSGLLTL